MTGRAQPTVEESFNWSLDGMETSCALTRQGTGPHTLLLPVHWQEPWGDRRQETVFIGSGIDWPTLKARLDAALLPAVVAGDPDALPDLPDPFPVWRGAEAAA